MNSRIWGGTIRRVWLSEGDKFRDHLLRLDRESRRMRFGMAVNDDFIGDYASRIGGTKGVVYGYFADGEMRAAAELCLIGDGRRMRRVRSRLSTRTRTRASAPSFWAASSGRREIAASRGCI